MFVSASYLFSVIQAAAVMQCNTCIQLKIHHNKISHSSPTRVGLLHKTHSKVLLVVQGSTSLITHSGKEKRQEWQCVCVCGGGGGGVGQDLKKGDKQTMTIAEL